MEAAFRGNEALACVLLEAGATSAGVKGARPDAIVRSVGAGVSKKTAGEVGNRAARRDDDETSERDAAEWANARGNARIAEMIERHRRGDSLAGFLAEGKRLVKTNVTPFSI